MATVGPDGSPVTEAGLNRLREQLAAMKRSKRRAPVVPLVQQASHNAETAALSNLPIRTAGGRTFGSNVTNIVSNGLCGSPQELCSSSTTVRSSSADEFAAAELLANSAEAIPTSIGPLTAKLVQMRGHCGVEPTIVQPIHHHEFPPSPALSDASFMTAADAVEPEQTLPQPTFEPAKAANTEQLPSVKPLAPELAIESTHSQPISEDASADITTVGVAMSKRRKLDGGRPDLPPTRPASARPPGKSAQTANTNAKLQSEIDALRKQNKLLKGEKADAARDKEGMSKTIKRLQAALGGKHNENCGNDGSVYRRLTAQERKASKLEQEVGAARQLQEELSQSEQQAKQTLATELQRAALTSQELETLRKTHATAAARLGVLETEVAEGRHALVELAQLRTQLERERLSGQAIERDAAHWRQRFDEGCNEAATARATAASSTSQCEHAAMEAASLRVSVEQLQMEVAAMREQQQRAAPKLARAEAARAEAAAQLARHVSEGGSASVIQRCWRMRRRKLEMREFRRAVSAARSARIHSVERCLKESAEQRAIELESKLEELTASLQLSGQLLQARDAERRKSISLSEQQRSDLEAEQRASAEAASRLAQCEQSAAREVESLHSQLSVAKRELEHEARKRVDALAEHQRATAAVTEQLAVAKESLRIAEGRAALGERSAQGMERTMEQLHRAEIGNLEQQAEGAREGMADARAELVREQAERRQCQAQVHRLSSMVEADAAEAAELRRTVQSLRAELLDAAQAKSVLITQLEDTTRQEAADAAYEELRREWAASRREVARLQSIIVERDTKIAALRTQSAVGTARSRAATGRAATPTKLSPRARRGASPRRVPQPQAHYEVVDERIESRQQACGRGTSPPARYTPHVQNYGGPKMAEDPDFDCADEIEESEGGGMEDHGRHGHNNSEAAKRESERIHVERLRAGRQRKDEEAAYAAGEAHFLINARKQAASEAEADFEMLEAEAEAVEAAVAEGHGHARQRLQKSAGATRRSAAPAGRRRPNSPAKRRRPSGSHCDGDSSTRGPRGKRRSGTAPPLSAPQPPRRCPRCRRGPISCRCDNSNSPWRSAASHTRDAEVSATELCQEEQNVFSRLSGGAALMRSSSRQSHTSAYAAAVTGLTRTRSGNTAYVV